MSAGLKLLGLVFRKEFLTGLMHGFAFISVLLYSVPKFCGWCISSDSWLRAVHTTTQGSRDTGVAGCKCKWTSSSEIRPPKENLITVALQLLISSPLPFTLPGGGCLFKRGPPEAAFHPLKRVELQTHGEQLPVFLESAGAWPPAPLRPSGAPWSIAEVERPWAATLLVGC